MALHVLCGLWLLGVSAVVPPPPETESPVTGRASCPQCLAVSDRHQAARLKVEAIKQQILSKLHLQNKPNITSPLPREVALEALRRTQGKLPGEQQVGDQGDGKEHPDASSKDDYYARTSEIIAFAEPGLSLNGHVLLDFYPSKEHAHRHLRVTAATLWIQLRYSSSLPKELRYLLRDHHLTLYVFRVANASTEPLSMDLLTSYRLGTAHAGWRRLEVGPAVQQWFSGSYQEKLTLLVDCVGCESFIEMVLFNDKPEESNNITASAATARRIRHSGGHELLGLRPFLAIATEPIDQRRVKRHSVTCDANVSHCCRQTLYVSFKELGWDDWIIAPKGYYANFCMGDCNSFRRTPDTYHNFHTHVIEEYRSRNPYASINPCCAPTRLSPMSLIYFDPDLNIIKTDLPKMIVEECGCT